jgi:hypothetical protein
MNLKIYRKLFVLCALTVGLFFAASTTSQAENSTCCDDCYDSYIHCATYTCQYGSRDCVQTFCYPIYVTCLSTCDRCN